MTLSIALAACGTGSAPTRRPKPRALAAGLPALPPLVRAAVRKSRPVVVFTSEAEGRLEPCGCVSGMLGGLVRRGSLLSRVAPEEVLSLEGGGWSAGSRDYEILKSRFYLRGLAIAGVDVVGLGTREVELGREGLAATLAEISEPGPAVVAANVFTTDGSPAVERTSTVLLNSTEFLVTSVVALDAIGQGLEIRDPAATLMDLVEGAGSRRVVVLADMDEDSLVALADAVPGVDLIVGGRVSSASESPVLAGATRVIYAANHGKIVGWWPWSGGSCSFEMITDDLPDDPRLRALVRQYQVSVAEADLQLDGTDDGLTDLASGGESYVGTDACESCHTGACQVHSDSRHARSLESLEAVGYQSDPECLACHVTALGKPTGYSRRGGPTPLGSVSCEACHGPASIHVVRPDQDDGALRPVTPATCSTCHDRENSPDFDYLLYWAQIAHDRQEDNAP